MTTMPKKSGTSDIMRGTHEFAVSSDNAQAVAKATEAWFAATAECQREMIGFISMRLEKDGGTTREIITCKNLADVAAIQSRWIEETLRDYSSEIGRLTTIYTKSINGGASPRG